MQETDSDDDLNAPDDRDLMTPGQILIRLCQDFLDEYDEGAERNSRLNRIAELINCQAGMDSIKPMTAGRLRDKIDGLIDAAGKSRHAERWLSDIEVEEAGWGDSGLSLEDLAFSLEGANEDGYDD